MICVIVSYANDACEKIAHASLSRRSFGTVHFFNHVLYHITGTLRVKVALVIDAILRQENGAYGATSIPDVCHAQC